MNKLNKKDLNRVKDLNRIISEDLDKTISKHEMLIEKLSDEIMETKRSLMSFKNLKALHNDLMEKDNMGG